MITRTRMRRTGACTRGGSGTTMATCGTSRRTKTRSTPSAVPTSGSSRKNIFDVDGVCRVDVHFALGQSYLYRKHYFANQRLKSESVFWVEDEVTMACVKNGWWRQYYESGNVASEMQYDQHGIRIGFCKRYASDGVIEWVKDYTKDYQERLAAFNRRKGELSLSVMEAAKELGFAELPTTVKEVNSVYRTKCAPVHPDKTPDPDATEVFISLSRARDVLVAYFERRTRTRRARPTGLRERGARVGGVCGGRRALDLPLRALLRCPSRGSAAVSSCCIGLLGRGRAHWGPPGTATWCLRPVGVRCWGIVRAAGHLCTGSAQTATGICFFPSLLVIAVGSILSGLPRAFRGCRSFLLSRLHVGWVPTPGAPLCFRGLSPLYLVPNGVFLCEKKN
eukprot:TRINITY_DN532_c0_g1_i11.p1 TRINITY_DN532_c0_g1~~TRINITY_DN532_c0_g1_i11.p1  ORF type:complete len:393 (+),score=79.69 TRINITY_DN532_c0_g1_i11:412-1590(+)